MPPKPTYEALEKRVAELEAHTLYLSQVQAELKRNLNFTESLLAAIPTPIFYKDLDGRYQGCNAAFSEIMGVTAEQIRGKTVRELWPDKHAGIYRQKDLELAENQQLQIYEFEIQDKDGRIRPVVYYKGVFHDEHGAVAGLVGGFIDISDIRLAQDELRQRRKFLESVLYHLPEAIITLDEQHRVVDWNPGAVKMFGYRPDETIGIHLDELVAPPPYRTEAGNATAQVLSGQRLESFETIRYRKDGTPIHVIVAGSPIIIDGVLKGVVAVYTDISERVQNEKALSLSHRRFITVLESIDATIYVADMDTHEILFMNKHMIETFGADYTGKICWQAFRGESAPCPNCSNDQLVDDDGKPSGVIAWQGKNPLTGKWYMNYDRAIEWIDGRLVKIQIATDITELKKLEEGLRRAQKLEAVGTLAGGIAHDFNNMLSAILGRAELTLLAMTPDDPQRSNLQEIHRAAERSAALTKQLLTFARKQAISPKVLHLNFVVEESLLMLRRLIGEDIDLVWQPDPHLWAVKIDPTQIEQILTNLCVNARDAIAGVGTIRIETRNLLVDNQQSPESLVIEPGEYVLLSVGDNGCGMDRKTLDNVFEPFFTTKKIGEGTGLGLATVYGIVKQNHGFIHACSEPNVGTTFSIYLPKQKHMLPETAVNSASNVSAGTETVLVVEDEEAILAMISTMLENHGYNVLTAKRPSQALEKVCNYKEIIHLLLTDVVMPEMNGKELKESVVAILPDIKILYMSGYTANVIMDRGVLDSDVHFLQKPFTLTDLAGKVRNILDEPISQAG